MMFDDISYKEHDDPKFYGKILVLLETLAKKHLPKYIYVIRISKWFDHTWLHFSGVGRVTSDAGPPAETTLREFWQDKLTLPPFNPKQIGDEYCFIKDEDDEYLRVFHHPWLHRRKLEPSSKNLNNRMERLTDSGLFVWFSSQTMANKRGSIMVYSIDGGEITTWFCSVNLHKDFAVEKVKGVDRNLVVEMLQ